MDFIYEIGGVDTVQDNLLSTFHNEQGTIEFTPTRPEVRGQLSLNNTIFGEDFAFLAQASHRARPS